MNVEFGDEVRFTYVMGGLARDYTSRANSPGSADDQMAGWLDV
ncbi:MAG: hypothetical protein JWN32_1196, partial [Solirubrobacterales bacterium]|nr:hypothetical protein [Solirubrobacterales bacterium]